MHSTSSDVLVLLYVCMVITVSKDNDQPGKGANLARGQLNRENYFSLSPFPPGSLFSRDRFGSPVPRQPAHLHTQAKLWWLLTGLLSSSAAVSIYLFKPPYAIGSVPNLSGHAIAYRWRSLPRVRQHRVSIPQGSSKRVRPWQVIMDQLICTSLSHTHYWYEVGMLKVSVSGHKYVFQKIFHQG